MKERIMTNIIETIEMAVEQGVKLDEKRRTRRGYNVNNRFQLDWEIEKNRHVFYGLLSAYIAMTGNFNASELDMWNVMEELKDRWTPERETPFTEKLEAAIKILIH